MKVYYWPSKNFGDTLSPIILGHFLNQKIELAGRQDTGKLLAVGSILHLVKENDVVWGTGLNRRIGLKCPPSVKFLAVRGPLTRSMIIGGEVPEVYGDPGILMPLIYNPSIEKKYKMGIMPHYVDKQFIRLKDGEKLIDIEDDWKKIIDDILSCQSITSSSLHGIVCANAYGVPVIWKKYSNKIMGGELKFQDYFAGIGIEPQKYGNTIPPIKQLYGRQCILIEALKNYYCKNQS